AVAYEHAVTVQRVIARLSILLRRTDIVHREHSLNTRGEAFLKIVDNTRFRPTRDFVTTKLQHYMNLACAGQKRAIALANKGGEIDPSDNEYFMRILRNWFKMEKNQKEFLEDMDKHLSTGVPHCAECKAAFGSKNDFYKHVTSYTHARKDQRMFAGYFIRLARGSRDWDITM
ncbi:hypothetical protein PENTCL1PPCAC_22141, partial [Pristionchus entomophagus]